MVVVVALVDDVVVEDVDSEGAGEMPVVVPALVSDTVVASVVVLACEGAESVECGDAVVGTFDGKSSLEYDSRLNDVRL